MPQIGLKYIHAARYNFENGAVNYTGRLKVGDAMTANIEPRNSEGSLYAEDAKAEYIKLMVGGTISLGVKYIKDDAKELLFGMRASEREISYTPAGASAATTVTVTGYKIGASDVGDYVGIAFYCLGMRDGAKKYYCFFVRKALFGPPGYSLQTKGENIQFATPTISGEFLMTDEEDQDFEETAIVDSEAAAKAWVDAVLAPAAGETTGGETSGSVTTGGETTGGETSGGGEG